MKVLFKTKALEELYVTPTSLIRGKKTFPIQVIKLYQSKVKILTLIEHLSELKPIKSLNFESLIGNRKGQYSIRLNKQYRLIFTKIEDQLIELEIIEISNHYE